MKGISTALVLGILSCIAFAPAGHADSKKKPQTIKDLDSQQIDISPDPPKGVDNAKTMESYKRFLDLNAGDAALREEAMRRLGDLNLESSESERIEHELATNEGLRATEAIHLYSALLKTYPNYERNDSVLYQLARAYELNAQPDKALATLDKLVANFPKSHYIDEAQFRRGEILFSNKSYPAAQSAYEAVIKFGSASGFYNQSLYKHGWSLFKQGESERSLESFSHVLDSVLVSKKDPRALVDIDTLSKPNRELVEDTFRVMSITFSYLDGPKSIDEFVKHKQPRPYYYLLYARLGDLYIEKERYTDAADSYRAFVSQDRNNEKAPLLEMQAIEAYSKGGFPDLVLQGKKEFVENYSYGTPFWQGRTPKDEPKVVAVLKTNLKDVAQYYHAQAQRTKNVADYQEAAKWYRSYLTSFPDDPESAVTNFLLADTLYESKQYLDAAQQYENTAYSYGTHEKAGEAGYAALVAYGKEEDGAAPDAKAKIHAKEVDSSLKFAQAFPTHPEVPQVLTRAATDLYAAKDYTRATAAAQTLLARQPPVDAAKQRVAYTVIANSNFEQGHFDKAEAGYASAQGLMAANDPERPAIVERLAASIYKQGEQKNQAGDSSGAVDDFLRVSKMAPTSKVRANADFDAGALLITQKQWDRAIVVLEDFRRNFPQSPLQEDVTRKLAVAYSESNHPGQAAVEFEMIAQSPTENPEVQREATLQAAESVRQGRQQREVARHARGLREAFPAAVESGDGGPQQALRDRPEIGRLHGPGLLAQGDHQCGPCGGGGANGSQQGARGQGDLDAGGPGAGGVHAGQARHPPQEVPGREAQGHGGCAQSLYPGRRLPGGGGDDRSHVRECRAVPTIGQGSDELGAPEGAVEGRIGAIRRVARGAGLPVRGEGDSTASGEYRTRQRGHLRRVGPEEFRGIGTTQPGALRQGGNR